MDSVGIKIDPKVSVIVPVYNAQKHIGRCIDSILNQTFREFEIIIINDGSKDKSSIICDNYARQYDNITVIHKENEGVSIARNIGISIAKGQYITFVDSDDYIDNTFLEYSVNKMDNDIDLYISGLVMETFNGEDIIKKDEYLGKNYEYSVKKLLENLNIDYPLICICGPWCKIYRKSILEEYNIKFNEELSLGEDTSFNIDYLSKCNKIYFSNEYFYHYRRENENSLFSRYNKDNYEVHKMVYDKMRLLYNQVNCCNESMNRFEKMYIDLLIGCIHYEFRHDSKRKKEVIKNIKNNKFIKAYKFKSDKTNFKQNILILLLKTKSTFIINLIFKLKYMKRTLA